eukprot:comp7601_c0_seq1/m.3250 comp7601_c0_seq1/g.3250  ORF comp7601_c0_seq1/g.3250 comp7601_c0_seq1/m.3250 type:complete len:192 (-) comp7601_c0_seq1:592-1167(-)
MADNSVPVTQMTATEPKPITNQPGVAVDSKNNGSSIPQITSSSGATGVPGESNRPAAGASNASMKANDALTRNKTVADASSALAPGMTTSLFGCLEDVAGALLSCCLPCVPAAVTRTQIEDRECTVFDCLCTPNPYQTRQIMRQKYNVPFSEAQDCFAYTCCSCCFVSQNVREYAALSGKEPLYFANPKGM